MGNFYGSIQIRTDDISKVKDILEEIVKKKKINFFLSSPLKGWIGVYPGGHGQDDTVSKSIARRIDCDIFHLINHDDDVFYYYFYRQGKLLDRYSSCPEYFGRISEREKKKLLGNPELFRDLFTDIKTFEKIKESLAPSFQEDIKTSNPFPGREKLLDFAHALGMSNVLTSYEYLSDGEILEIEQWDNFTHIPDMSKIKEKRKKIDEKFLTEKKRLHDRGLLLFERSADDTPWTIPVWCQSPSGRGFFVCWNKGDPYSNCDIKRYEPPWSIEPVSAGFSTVSSINLLKLSPSGKYLATGYTYGKAEVWYIGKKEPLLEIVHSKLVSWFEFSRDENFIYTGSCHEINVTSIEKKSPVYSFKISGGPGKAALHPSGKYLVVDDQFKLSIIDLVSKKQIKKLYVGKKQDFTSIFNMFIPKIEKEFKNSGINLPDKVSFNKIQGSERLACLEFSSDGEMLFCGTDKGVRVFSWNDLLKAADETPDPLFSVSAETVSTKNDFLQSYIYSLAFDVSVKRLLFAGMEGKIKYLDLLTGQSDTLVEIPGRPPVLHIGFSGDKSKLCSTCRPGLLDRKNIPFLLQIWNYTELHKKISHL